MARFAIPDWLNHTCIGCGECCRRGLIIWCPNKDKELYDKTDWPSVHPNLAGGRLFKPISQGHAFTMTSEGACRFIDDDNKCIMHGKLGFDAKTLTCKMYPYNLTASGPEVRVGVLFSCPAVVDNTGEPVKNQTKLLNNLFKEQEELFGKQPNNNETALTWDISVRLSKSALLEDTLIKILDSDLPFIRKIINAANLVDKLEECDEAQLGEDFFGKTLMHFEERARDAAENCGLSKPKTGVFESLLLRQLQAMCCSLAERGLNDERFWVRQKSRLHRLGIGIKYLIGIGLVPIDGNSISFKDVEKIACYKIPEQSEDLILRYLKTRIYSRVYYGSQGWGLPVLSGARLTLLLTSIILWYAKAAAAVAGRSEVEHADVRAGVLITDHTFGHASSDTLMINQRAMRVVNRSGWVQNSLLNMML